MIDLRKHPVWEKVNPIKKQGHLARFYLAKQYARLVPSTKLIGITGSVGKTTTSLACKAVLSQAMNVLSTTDTSSNLDPIFNLPMTLLKVRPNIEKVILELGIEYKGEMELYLSVVRPKTAIITRIFYAHSEFLGGVEGILDEKGKLIEQLPKDGLAILNWDDPNTKKLAKKTKARILYFGTDPKHCSVWAGNIRIKDYKTVFELHSGSEKITVASQLLGSHQIYSLLAAAALGVSLGIPLDVIKKGLESMKPAVHRMNVLKGPKGSIVIDDVHNSSPSAAIEALETVKLIKSSRKIVVLGEMRELGKYSKRLHQSVAKKIFKNKLNLVITGLGEAKYISDELLKLGYDSKRLISGLTNKEITSFLRKTAKKSDLILIKGSRHTYMEEIVKKIAKPQEA